MALAKASLSITKDNPSGSGVMVDASNDYMQTARHGCNSGTVIAVGVVGLMMLTDRINWRYGAIVRMGWFDLLEAPSIAAGHLSTAMFGN